MELTNLKPTDRTIEITSPLSGQPLGLRVRIMSLEDDRLKRIKRQFTDESLKLQAKGKAIKADEVERNAHMLMFAGTLGWEWYNPTGSEGDEGYDAAQAPTFHDEVPEFNQKNFIGLITEVTWIGEQISEAIGDTKSFFDSLRTT
jgi:hypothetical protein